jgi:hypothetical protein
VVDFILFDGFYSVLDQWLVLKTQTELSNPQGAGPSVWIFGLLTVILGMLYPLLSSLFIFSILTKSTLPFQFMKNFELALIEVLRAWGKSFLWSFLLIIPGLIRFAQYFFVPFVVCFDPAYQRGEVDALTRSQEISRGRTLWLIALLFLFDAALPLILSLFEEWSVIWQTPIPALGLCFLEMLINFCFIWILWRIYEPTVSMERYQNA